MEDILASIRRIIADDHDPERPPEPEEPAPSPLKNVLDLAELHVAPLIAQKPVTAQVESWTREEIVFAEIGRANGPGPELSPTWNPAEPVRTPVPPSEPAPKKAAVLQAAAEPVPAEALLSSKAGASVSTAFDRLSASVRPSQPQTVEDLMKEMLRPMLKAWLDDHLPSLVEGLVRDEIERVTRRRG